MRAITRNPESGAAKALAKLGADVVSADLTDPSTLSAAFAGCWGAFVVTNFYDAVSPSVRPPEPGDWPVGRRCTNRLTPWGPLDNQRRPGE